MNDYIGQEKSISILKDELTESRGSVSFNIVGAVGSGKSALLEFVRQKLATSADDWTLWRGEAEVVKMDGQHYAQGTSFIEFFMDGLQRHFGKEFVELKRTEEVEPAEDPSSIAYILRQLTKNNICLVIMIDNFANIMERLQTAEARRLNYLKYARVNYILVTDHRSASEINQVMYSASTFFQDIIEVHLHPLLPKNAQRFLQQECESLEDSCILTDSDLKMIRELGGGHPGLLKGLVRLLIFEKSLRGGDDQWQKRPLSQTNRSVLHLLLQGEIIQYYLDKITDTLIKFLSLTAQEVLIEIAMNQFGDENSHASHVFDDRMRERLLAMGLIATEEVLIPVISSKLIQFTILRNLTDAPFSAAEEAAFKLLRENGTALTSFEALDAALDKFMPEVAEEKATKGKRDPRRRFIDGTMIRVRNKLEEASNSAAFVLENARGRGFYMYSRVSFDEFYEHGPSVFSS